MGVTKEKILSQRLALKDTMVKPWVCREKRPPAWHAQRVSAAKLALLSHKDVDQDSMHQQVQAHASSAPKDGTAQVALETHLSAKKDILL